MKLEREWEFETVLTCGLTTAIQPCDKIHRIVSILTLKDRTTDIVNIKEYERCGD